MIPVSVVIPTVFPVLPSATAPVAPVVIAPTDRAAVFSIVTAGLSLLVVVSVPLWVNTAPPLSIKISPVPPSTVVAAVCVSATVLDSENPLPVVNPPRLPIALAWLNDALVSALPVSAVAVIVPGPVAVSLIIPAEFSVTVGIGVPPDAMIAWFSVMSPDVVVLSVTAPPFVCISNDRAPNSHHSRSASCAASSPCLA